MPVYRFHKCVALLATMLAVSGAHGGPAQRYSYYSPGVGTVNLDNRAVEPRLFAVRGRALPGDVVVLTSWSRRLLRVSGSGKVRWILNVFGAGGAHGLSAYRGRLVVGHGREILFVDPENGEVTDRIQVFEAALEAINFVRVQGNVLLLGESAERSHILIARLEEGTRGELMVSAIERIPTRTQWPRDAVLMNDGRLAIADTYGHAVVFLERSDRWREVRRMTEFYPNMLSLTSDREGLVVLSEHANRLTRWDLRDDTRATLIACPDPLFQDPNTSPSQIQSEETRTLSSGSPPRQLCATGVAGDQTLYAANGHFVDGDHNIWVADADNHRVALFVDGVFRGAIENINNPVRVIPVSHLTPGGSARKPVTNHKPASQAR